MKKVIWVSSTIILATILSFVGFANPASAKEPFGKTDCEHFCGLLNDPIKIETGYIAGTLLGEPDNPVHIYRGIPYAAPPVGDLRWKPPQPVAPWAGIRECTVFSPAAPQDPPGPPFPQQNRSEDCLYLNVLTQAKHTCERLPVMVWFHGGGFVNGSANNEEYTSIPLAQHGVVLVTVNHRLGMIGFLAHPLLSAESPKGVSGNYEFLDLIASLKWVQKNIAAFGGDPNNVTIFGQSGGGWKVTAMMTSPLAKGLFHRAIIESGAGLRGTPLSDLEKRGEKLFAMLGVSTLEDARALSWQTIIDTDNTLSAQEPLPAGWQAAVDGWVLPDTPENIFQAGQQNAVPLTVGAVLGELPTLGKLMNMIPYYEELFAGNYKVNTRSYAYIFNHVPAGWKQEGIASCHAMDLEYIFGVWDDLNTWVQLMPLAGATDPNPGLTDVDGKLSEEMMAMTTHFAKTGNPNVRGLVWWPAWDPATDKYLYITEVLEVESGFSEVGQ